MAHVNSSEKVSVRCSGNVLTTSMRLMVIGYISSQCQKPIFDLKTFAWGTSAKVKVFGTTVLEIGAWRKQLMVDILGKLVRLRIRCPVQRTGANCLRAAACDGKSHQQPLAMSV